MDALLLGLGQAEDRTGIVSQNETCEFIGLEYLRAYAKQKGFEVEVKHPPQNLQKIIEEAPKIVGFSVMTSNYEPSRKFSQRLKRKNPNTKIIWGGPHATTCNEEALREGSVDYVVLGEGEKTFSNLIEGIQKGKDMSKLDGLAFYDGKRIIKNPRPTRLTGKELDEINPKDLHQLEDYGIFFAKQMPHSIPASEMNFAMISGSRGCWNNCSFCSSNSLWGRNIQYRSPNKIVDELGHLVDKKGVNFVFFSDDDFLINGNWAKSIAEGIAQRGIDVNLHAMASVRSASKFNDYDLLKRAGIKEITIGMETTNQRIIDQMGKGYDLKMLPFVANEITSHEIHLGLYYMLGYPGQTKEDLDMDHDYIQKIPFSRIRAVFATPYPETALYDQVNRENLWLEGYKDNWSAFTNDQPVIKTPATPEELIDARKKVLELYQSPAYISRMKNMYRGNIKSQKAFEEFQDFLKGVLK
jgi:radical SAM superfamily enzyme YgiQ (UPF0313 family)